MRGTCHGTIISLLSLKSSIRVGRAVTTELGQQLNLLGSGRDEGTGLRYTPQRDAARRSLFQDLPINNVREGVVGCRILAGRRCGSRMPLASPSNILIVSSVDSATTVGSVQLMVRKKFKRHGAASLVKLRVKGDRPGCARIDTPDEPYGAPYSKLFSPFMTRVGSRSPKSLHSE